MAKIASFHETRPRYPVLRLIGFLCTCAGAILTLIGAGMLVFGLYTLATQGGGVLLPPTPPPLPGRPIATASWLVVGGSSFLWSLGSLMAGLQLLGQGAFLQLMIHLEENTRASAQMLDQMRSRLGLDPERAESIFRS